MNEYVGYNQVIPHLAEMLRNLDFPWNCSRSGDFVHFPEGI